MHVHDDSISSLQVETKTTGPSGEDEDLVLRVRGIEEGDVARTIFSLRTTIETEVLPAHHLQKVLHDIHDLCHLEENEYLLLEDRSMSMKNENLTKGSYLTL